MKNLINRGVSFYLLLTIYASPISTPISNYLVIWDVGQGQWVTLKTKNTCLHIDMGGEYFPRNEIEKLCSHADNAIYFSHADNDHINFYNYFSLRFKKYCVANTPPQLKNKLKTKKIPKCKNKYQENQIIYQSKKQNPKSLNESSSVFLISGFLLNPGDSTSQAEKKWRQHKSLSSTHILLLGHHGSKTSTSHELLDKLPHLKWSIASARKRKYGHPHGIVDLKMKLNKTPIISTQNWGSIWLEL